MSNQANLRPLNDNVLVKPNKQEERTPGGLIRIETAHEPPVEGVVVAVGPGRLLENGKRSKPEVEAGVTVLYAKFAGTDVELDGIKYKMLKEDMILAILAGTKTGG